jgi:hypothetical protein
LKFEEKLLLQTLLLPATATSIGASIKNPKKKIEKLMLFE